MAGARFTLTGDFPTHLGQTRTGYIEFTTDVVDTAEDDVWSRPFSVKITDGQVEISDLPAWDPTILPYSASEPQFGLKFTYAGESWTFAPVAAGDTLDLSDVVEPFAAPVTASQYSEIVATAVQVATDRAAVEALGTTNDTVIAGRINALGSATDVALKGAFVALPSLAEKVVYVTTRGNDSNDGLTPKTAKLTIAAGLSALGGTPGRIQLSYATISTAATHTLPTGTQIVGAGRGMSKIGYTGSGTLFQGVSGTRTYDVAIMDVAITGPGKATTSVAVDMVDMSDAFLYNFIIGSFGTGIKHRSTISGGAVYNRYFNGFLTSCGIGADFSSVGSNGSGWKYVKFGACTTGVNIVDSNQNNFDACQFEVNTTGFFIDATLAGKSDHNSFTCCRFELNTTAWVINSTAVRSTVIDWPATFDTYTYTNNGARTAQESASSLSFRESATADADGSWRFDRTANGGSLLPAMVVRDSATSSGTPVTLQVETERSGGYPFRAVRGGVTIMDVDTAGNLRLAAGGSVTVGGVAIGGGAAATDWTMPTAAQAQTFPRTAATANSPILTSGSLLMVGIPLVAGQTISSITFCSSTTALATGSNQWFALYSSARALLRVTSDDTSTAWAAEALKTLTLASSYVVPTSGLYYVGICVVATTVPSLRAAAVGSRITGQAPIMSGGSSTGLTNPASAPSTAAALTAAVSVPYAYVS